MQSPKQLLCATALPSMASAAFLIGQDVEGHWLAIQASGLRGGIFTNKDAAVHYAREETHMSDDQLYFVAEPLKL